MPTNDPWKIHGYFFSACFGVFSVLLMRWFAALVDIPDDVPVNQVLTPIGQVLLLLLFGVAAALAYLLARYASLAAAAVLGALRRRWMRHRADRTDKG